MVLDTQSIRAANHVPAATTGKDAGKRVPGRKRGLAVDALGLIIAVVVTHRWVVERTHGTLMLHRRLAREYESLPASSVSHTLWASNLTRRLTGTTTPTWHTPTRT